jgi:hypothetical protein
VKERSIFVTNEPVAASRFARRAVTAISASRQIPGSINISRAFRGMEGHFRNFLKHGASRLKQGTAFF